MNGKSPVGRVDRISGPTVVDQIRANAAVLTVVALLGLGISFFLAFLHFERHVTVHRLISDPNSAVGMRWYYGSLSHAGVLIWTASAAICVFVARVLWESVDKRGRRLSHFLALLGAGSLWFALDDLLLIHEQLGRLMFDQDGRHTGEALVFGVYALSLLGCLFWYRDTVAETEVVLLVAAVVTLGASVAIDTLLQLDIGGNNYILEIVLSVSWGGPTIDIVEDVLKLSGGMLMLAYFFQTGYAAIRHEVAPSTAVAVEAPGVEAKLKERRQANHP